MKKAASMAHVDTSPRGKTRSASIMIINKLAVAGTSLPVPRISFLDVLPCRPDPSLMGDKFEGRMLLHLFASCFTEDSYLRVQLTSQVSLHITPSFPHPPPQIFSLHRISDSLAASSALFSLVLASFGLHPAKTMSSRSSPLSFFKISHHRALTDNFANDPTREETPVTQPVIIEACWVE